MIFRVFVRVRIGPVDDLFRPTMEIIEEEDIAAAAAEAMNRFDHVGNGRVVAIEEA